MPEGCPPIAITSVCSQRHWMLSEREAICLFYEYSYNTRGLRTSFVCITVLLNVIRRDCMATAIPRFESNRHMCALLPMQVITSGLATHFYTRAGPRTSAYVIGPFYVRHARLTINSIFAHVKNSQHYQPLRSRLFFSNLAHAVAEWFHCYMCIQGTSYLNLLLLSSSPHHSSSSRTKALKLHVVSAEEEGGGYMYTLHVHVRIPSTLTYMYTATLIGGQTLNRCLKHGSVVH